MAVLINGEPFNHGLEDEGISSRPVVETPTQPSADQLAHAQNTDTGTTAEFFKLALNVAPGAGAVRRGIVFNNGGVGPVTALAWEARNSGGSPTGRFVQCLNVIGGDPKAEGNLWTEYGFTPIPENEYGIHPPFELIRDAVTFLLVANSAATPPVIGGFNPASGAVTESILINGNNFGTITGSVELNGVACVVNGWSNSQISAKVPAGATTGKFTVTTDGGSDVSRDLFTVTAAVVYGPPAAPADVIATNQNQAVALAWLASADTGNLPIINWQVEYIDAEVLDATWRKYPHSPSAATGITVSGLTNGHTYNFRISAITTSYTGVPSAVVEGAPVGLSVVYQATEQSYTTTSADLISICGAGTTAQPNTATSTDGVSSVSQEAANAIALSRAKQVALAGVVCPVATGSASNFPAQNAGTKGKALFSDGEAGAEYWGEASSGGGSGDLVDIDFTTFANVDIAHVELEANWTATGYYAGPDLETPAWHVHYKLPTMAAHGYEYKTVPNPGEVAATVVRIQL